MPGCFVKGCGSGRRKKEDDLTLHTFPREPENVRRWLLGLGHDSKMVDALVTTILENRTSAYRLCSRHFTRESYEKRGSKWFLRKEAVPSLYLQQEGTWEHTYAVPSPHFQEEGTPQEKGKWEHTYTKRRRKEDLSTSNNDYTQILLSSSTPPPGVSTSSPDVLPHQSEDQYWVECLDVQSVENVETSELGKHLVSAGTAFETPTGARPPRDRQIWNVATSAEYVPGQSHKYTQYEYRFGRKSKSIQVACRPNHRSIAVQCNIANFPPLSQGKVPQHLTTFNSIGTQTTPMEREMKTGQGGIAQDPFCVLPKQNVWGLSLHLHGRPTFDFFKRRRN